MPRIALPRLRSPRNPQPPRFAFHSFTPQQLPPRFRLPSSPSFFFFIIFLLIPPLPPFFPPLSSPLFSVFPAPRLAAPPAGRCRTWRCCCCWRPRRCGCVCAGRSPAPRRWPIATPSTGTAPTPGTRGARGRAPGPAGGRAAPLRRLAAARWKGEKNFLFRGGSGGLAAGSDGGAGWFFSSPPSLPSEASRDGCAPASRDAILAAGQPVSAASAAPAAREGCGAQGAAPRWCPGVVRGGFARRCPAGALPGGLEVRKRGRYAVPSPGSPPSGPSGAGAVAPLPWRRRVPSTRL